MYNTYMKHKELLACAIGIIIGAMVTYLFTEYSAKENTYDTPYHVHADFKIYVQGNLLDLSTDEYMTTALQELSDYVHLHDNNDDVEHIHLEGVTFSEFLGTLGLSLTNSCLTFADTTYCSSDSEKLVLYVNDELYLDSIVDFVPQDEDRVLLVFGDTAQTNITTLLDTVTNDACYYSGTCPERGIAPPESCGLTCEL